MSAPLEWPRLKARLRPLVARQVPTADVDDVLQDALLRVQLGLPGLRDPSRLEPWALQAARCAVGSYWEVRRRHPLVKAADDERALGDEEAEPEAPDDSARRCLATYLTARVEDLPDIYCQAVKLTELEGLGVTEAASRAGVSPAAMKSRMRRGRMLLRRMAEKCCRLEFDARSSVTDCVARTGTAARLELELKARACSPGCDEAQRSPPAPSSRSAPAPFPAYHRPASIGGRSCLMTFPSVAAA